MMLRLLKLALRNVLRSRARSLLTMGAIGFGVLMTLVLGAFIAGLGNAIIDNVVKGKVGAIQVHRKGYDDVRENQPLDLDLPADAPWLAEIAALPGVTGVAPRLVFSGILSNGSQSGNFVGVGVDPRHDARALPARRQGLAGQHIGDDPGATAVAVMGKQLADALDAKVARSGVAGGEGATLSLQAATAEGQQNAMDVELIGSVDADTPFDSKRLVYVPLAFAQELLSMPGRITEVVVAVEDRGQVDAIAAQIAARLGTDYEVRTWDQLRPNVADLVRVQRMVLGAIGVVFLVIAVIGVVNTMLMSVMERTREIGTMMAVGVRRSRITLLFLAEGLALSLIGGGVGALLALALVSAVASAGGLQVTPPGGTSLFALIPVVPLWLYAPTLALTLLGTLLAAAGPAWRASRLRPVEALRAL